MYYDKEIDMGNLAAKGFVPNEEEKWKPTRDDYENRKRMFEVDSASEYKRLVIRAYECGLAWEYSCTYAENRSREYLNMDMEFLNKNHPFVHTPEGKLMLAAKKEITSAD